MKIATINAWSGRLSKELLDFLHKNQTIDIFCFQEVYHNETTAHLTQSNYEPNLHLFEDIQKTLPTHAGFFRPHYLNTYGLAIYVKKEYEVELEEEHFVYHHKNYIPKGHVGNHARNVQVIVISTHKMKSLAIFNFHGLWNGAGKTDCPERVEQSKKLINYMKKFSTQKILCGDFNLEPHTKSIKMLEELPLRNLVQEYKIPSTRTYHYTKECMYADYVFVSQDIVVENFRTLPDIVSDHSILLLEINT